MRARRIQKLLRVLPAAVSGPLIRRNCRIEPSRVEGMVFKIAEAREELEAAYRLVHDVYVQEGYSDSHQSGLRVNLRYALPTTTTFVGIHEGKVVITMTLVGDSPLGLPMDAIFSRELYSFRRQGRFIAEVSALASDPEYRRGTQALALFSNKIMWLYAIRNLRVDDLVIAINPKHRWVYETLILFEPVSSGVKSYHYVKDAPAIAMRLDLRTVLTRMERAYRGLPRGVNLYDFFANQESPQIRLPDPGEPYNVWDEELFSYFFEQRTDQRREGAGSLLDLYRILHTMPNGERLIPDAKEPHAAADASVQRGFDFEI
jgi:hypothetical protein